MTGLGPAIIAEAYVEACYGELLALKPGNVHIHAASDDGSVVDFRASAEVSAGPLTAPGASIGRRVLGAIEATQRSVGWNTNLGIVLLCAPIAAAAETGGTLRAVLRHRLDALDGADAAQAFAAIRLADPGGLGRAPAHDVTLPPPGTLREAMAASADRDRIARAYVTGMEDIFAIGLPALRAARARGAARHWGIATVYMAYLSSEPDTHIARKFGADAAEAVRRRAAALVAAIEIGEGAVAPLLAFDAALKLEGLNPGTSADFTVATTFLDNILMLGGGES